MVKLKKSQLKELIRHSIRKLTSEREDVTESKKRRFTVKEVRMWMKKLEENRYKKVYNSDARRVAWMVNNEGVELSEMPKSMSKKWTKAQYGRERYLATEFLKSKSEQMTEGKLSEGFKKIALKKVKYKTKMSGMMFSFDWEIESGIDTDVMGGNTPKIILHYVRTELEGEYKGDKISGGNTIYLKHKNGKPYTPQEAKKLVNKIANKKIMDFQKKSQNPSGSGQNVYYQDGKFLREGKLTSEQKLRQTIRGIIKEQLNEAYRSQSIFFDKKDKSKLEKLLKKNKGKFPFNPSGESVVNWSLNDKGSKGLEWRGIPKEKYNKAVEFFMKNKLNPRG